MSITKIVPNKVQNFLSRREGREFCKANGIKQSLLKKDPVTGTWNVIDDKPTTETKGITKISIPKKPVESTKKKNKKLTFKVREVQRDPKRFLADTWYTFKDPESREKFKGDLKYNHHITKRIDSVGACLCIDKCRDGFNPSQIKYITFKEKSNHTCYPNLCLYKSERKYFVEVDVLPDAKTKQAFNAPGYIVKENQTDVDNFVKDTYYAFIDEPSKLSFMNRSVHNAPFIVNMANGVFVTRCPGKHNEHAWCVQFNEYDDIKNESSRMVIPLERKYFVEVERVSTATPMSCQRNVKFVRISGQSYGNPLNRLLPKHAKLIRETQSRIGYLVVDSETNMLYNICKLTNEQLALFEEI